MTTSSSKDVSAMRALCREVCSRRLRSCPLCLCTLSPLSCRPCMMVVDQRYCCAGCSPQFATCHDQHCQQLACRHTPSAGGPSGQGAVAVRSHGVWAAAVVVARLLQMRTRQSSVCVHELELLAAAAALVELRFTLHVSEPSPSTAACAHSACLRAPAGQGVGEVAQVEQAQHAHDVFPEGLCQPALR